MNVKIIVLISLFLMGFKPISEVSQRTVSDKEFDEYMIAYKNAEIDFEIRRRIAILKSVEWVESRHNMNAYNIAEDAIGVMQIRPVMIKELEQIGYRFKHSDAWSVDVSNSIFVKYQNRFNPDWDPELAARKWNGGREGEKKLSTEQYWRRVEQRIDELMCCVD